VAVLEAQAVAVQVAIKKVSRWNLLRQAQLWPLTAERETANGSMLEISALAVSPAEEAPKPKKDSASHLLTAARNALALTDSKESATHSHVLAAQVVPEALAEQAVWSLSTTWLLKHSQ